jgi:cytochrome c biogenesis protein CcmG, thiol:disulfide interchange protein DsbE
VSKQWTFVAVIVGGLLAGAAAMVWFGADATRVEVGKPAPEFRAIDLRTGDSVSLRDRYRGQVTLVNIWATWCLPCKVEMPSMEKLFQSVGSQGFKIAAVSIDQGAPEDVLAFASNLHVSFDILQDRGGRIQELYETTGVPESFLLDRHGVLIKRVIGAHDWDSEVNRKLIQRLLDEAEK